MSLSLARRGEKRRERENKKDKLRVQLNIRTVCRKNYKYDVIIRRTSDQNIGQSDVSVESFDGRLMTKSSIKISRYDRLPGE